MIVGLIVRSFKIYSAWTFVPISCGDYFTAFIGDNGVGKSSVLEALDFYFNKHIQQWNYNHTSIKGGLHKSPPEICPIFIFKKKDINHRSKVYEYLKNINDILWGLGKSEYNPTYSKIIGQIESHFERLSIQGFNKEDYFLFASGVRKYKGQTEFSMAFFNNSKAWRTLCFGDEYESGEIDEEIERGYMRDYQTEIVSYVRENIDYIYIPSELDYQQYTKIEGATIQSLMGTSVDDIIRSIIDDSVVKNINSGLDRFLKGVEENLDKYQYKKPSVYQTRFNLSHLSSKIIETYFDSKVLNLKSSSSQLIPIYECSSGEKRRAIIDLAEAFILKARRSSKDKLVVLSIDEPEVSLHMSACFDQFAKIEEISKNDIQTIVSTHWYGFLPSASKGNAIYIAESEGSKWFNFINLTRYREDIKELKAKTNGMLPVNIELKTINDTVQSVISTIVYSNVCWIICEGASDRIYFNSFFNNMKNVRVVSVGGSRYVKQFYEYLYLALDDERSSINGRVFLIVDTDKQFEKYQAKTSIKQISFKRLQNCTQEKCIKLESTSSSNNTPATTIEDSLEPKFFIETLKSFLNDNPEVEDILSAPKIEHAQSSGFAFDLRITERDLLDKFFDSPRKKCEFAKRYCGLSKDSVPSWVEEIRMFFNS